ncbi:aminodeoxychorismate synthase component I [Portibacter lacus]
MNHLGASRTPFFFMIDFELENINVFKLDELDDVFFDVNGVKNHHIPYGQANIKLEKGRIPFMDYKKSFDLVYKELQYGNTFLLNLTSATEIKLNNSLFDIFLNSKAKYKLFFKDEFVCFSPEPFIKIDNDIISSYPMKGTANANIPNAAEKLIANEKELSEHYTIVDLIRNDLSIVADNVRVSKFRYLETIASNNQVLYQLSSKIEGDLSSEWHNEIGSILEKILPAGSISGAPKKKTVEIIQAAENQKRGYYTGIMGYYNGVTLDAGVMIRFIEKKGDQYFYRSGGGITFMSDLNSEYSELIDKIYVPVFRNN